MVYAIIKVDGSTAVPIFRKRIPAGIIGARVQFEFGAGWEGRSRTVVFQAGDLTKDVVLSQEDVATIPAEVVAAPVNSLRVGVYGTKADGTALPTLWAELGRVYYAADPSGDESTDPSLPVWAQLQQQVDELKQSGGTGVGGASFKTDETLTLKNGILSVNTTDQMEQDNTLPITSAGVFATVGNIEALLKTI